MSADKKSVDAKLAVVIDHLRARYTIGFRPTDDRDDGKFRPVEIRITGTRTEKERPVVLTKRGYYFRKRFRRSNANFAALPGDNPETMKES